MYVPCVIRALSALQQKMLNLLMLAQNYRIIKQFNVKT